MQKYCLGINKTAGACGIINLLLIAVVLGDFN